MVVVSHLFSFFKKIWARSGSSEPLLALFRTVYFPTAPFSYMVNNQSPGQNNASLWAGTVALP